VTARSTPELFPLVEIHERVRGYCARVIIEGKNHIITADDLVWSFPGGDQIRKSSKDFTAWIILKQAVSKFMATPVMFRYWVQDSPETPHSQRRWRLRDQPLPPDIIPSVKPLPRGWIKEEPGRWIPTYDFEPWETRLARYRKVCSQLEVVENGGAVKDSFTVEGVKA
jgi:hypothetical protein